MRSRYLIHEPDRAHFITATVVQWLPIFTSPACCDIIVRSLEHCRQHKALKIHAWVILTAPDLSAVLRDFKSYTAYQLIEQLATDPRQWLLSQLRHYRAPHKPTEYQVWQEGSHPQAIVTDERMQQKLDYLHNNPVQRGMVASPEHWRYGALPVLRCDPWR